MISKITKPRVYRDYVVYDLEWIPGTLQIRLVGVYCRNRGYRYYTSIEDFVAAELTHKNRGKWFYAHAGGLADFQFLLEHMATRQEFRLKAAFSGSSAIIVHVARGKNSFHFVDSLWLFRDTLRNIGKHVGISKGNADESVEFYSEASVEELVEYNRIDCLILYTAIEQFESTLMELGGQLKMTIASCGMELFRRRFLKADIETSQSVNQIARNAYFASRVEVITTHCDAAYYYDVNSSFPYSMTQPLPGEMQGTSRRLPDKGIYIADVDVTIPDTYFPSLPVRYEQRLFFPTGRFRNWYSNVDIELLLKTGGKINRVYEAIRFEDNTDLKEYVETLYNLRKNAVGFEKIVYKYLMNCVYGKFAEIDVKSQMVINPKTRPPIEDMVSPGIFVSDKVVPIPHMHVPISVHITAIARKTLYDYMSQSSELHYCDTDGFSTTNRFQDGNELGQIKLEKMIYEGRFVAAKVYKLDGVKAEWPESHYRLEEGVSGPLRHIGNDGVRAKGFSKMTVEKFDRLSKNVRLDATHALNDESVLATMTLEELERARRDEEIAYTRMRRIKEVVRGAGVTGVHPREDEIKKKLRNPIPKRFFYPDGHSRPWHISELKEMLK